MPSVVDVRACVAYTREEKSSLEAAKPPKSGGGGAVWVNESHLSICSYLFSCSRIESRKETRMKPKVGLIVPGCIPYDPLMAKPEMKEKAIAELGKLDMDILAIEGIPATKPEILSAADRLRKEDVDGVVVYQADYSSEELGCILGMELKEYPMLLWTGWGSPKALVPLSGLFTMASNLKRLGKDFSYIVGEPEETEIKSKILSFARAAMAAKGLRRASIGIVGLSNSGMLDTTFSAFHMRKIVPNILNLDTYELVKLYEKAEDGAANKIVKELKDKVGKIEVEEKQLVDAAKVYLAMKSMVEKYQLDAITVREWPELGESFITMCVGSALLNEEGVVCVQEADISGTITSLAMYYLTGKPTYLGEVALGDPVNNMVILFHEGASPFSLAEKKEDITLTYAGISVGVWTGKQEGVNVQFATKPGKVTVAKLTGRPIEDRLRMIITSGEVISAPTPPTGGSSNAFLKFDVPLKDLIDAWVNCGFEHHKILVYEDVRTDLEYLCDILGIEKIVL